MSDTEKVFTCEEVKELCRDAFDTGTLYERESTYYGVTLSRITGRIG